MVSRNHPNVGRDGRRGDFAPDHDGHHRSRHTIDRDVELSIARASAATNQVYFIDINGVGDGGLGRSIVMDPSGYVLHEGGRVTTEIIPVKIDFEKVRRERERGLRGLGQPLKTFRDREVDFSIYQRGSAAEAYLHSLGKLAKPGATGDTHPLATGPAGE